MTYPSQSPEKLRQVTSEWLKKVRTHGQSPNRDVMFGPGASPDWSSDQTVPAHGFLLTDGRSEGSGYLVLEDGDVLSLEEESWMSSPSDDLMAVLGRSITDAMYRRQGHFANGPDVQWVPDRRATEVRYWGPERRNYG